MKRNLSLFLIIVLSIYFAVSTAWRRIFAPYHTYLSGSTALYTASALNGIASVHGSKPSTQTTTADNPCLRKSLSESEQLTFARKGHIFLPHTLSPSFLKDQLFPQLKGAEERRQLASMKHLLKTSGGDIAKDLDIDRMDINQCEDALKMLTDIDPDALPFLQLFHLWRDPSCSAARELACYSEGLAKLAAQALGVPAVRLYQVSIKMLRTNGKQ